MAHKCARAHARDRVKPGGIGVLLGQLTTLWGLVVTRGTLSHFLRKEMDCNFALLVYCEQRKGTVSQSQ